MENYEQKLESFRQQWNLPDYNLDRLAESVQALRFADSFLTGASSDNSPTAQYKKWFSRTLSIYFATNTTPNENGKYMSSFDSQAFYNSFKTLVQAKYDSDALNKNVKLLNVDDVTKGEKENIQKIIANCRRNYKKTLPTLWQENLKDGSLKLETLKDITENSYNALGNRLDYAEDELNAKLTNLVAAREAMKQLRASRSGVWGWLWKVIFNREQNRQEKEYLKDLNDKINELSSSYNIEEKVAELTGKTVLGKTLTEEKAKKQEEPAKSQEQPAPVQEQPAKIQEQPIKKSSNPVKIKSCAKKIENNYYDNNLDEKIAKELLTKIPVRGAESYRQRVLETMIIKPAFETINNLNVEFDQDIKNGNQKEAVAKLVRGVFKAAYQQTPLTISGSGINKVDGCAILAQTFINNLTAVSIYPDLKGLANEYIKNNTALCKEIIEEDYFYTEKVDEYAVDYVPSGEVSHEQVFDVNDNPFLEDVAHKSPQISGQIKQDVPRIDK